MAPAASLAAAAGQSSDDLAARNIIGTLKLQLGIFWQANIGLFPESEPNSHPVSNWFIVLAAIQDQLTTGTQPLQSLSPAENAVYRLLWMASFLFGAGLITATQANTLLASYNTLIAFP